ncbi:hypothetical protein [Pseudoalteromonas luteoviolacea]|uniref:Uncharacterized protein n=1 Tax=Pseudoalteromonas luteoviolacea S4060-1 TaxID=1365257 RepID=A0A167KLW5_9GAMM|nr:hypothetical protein [Pseudoalteromonas luteoviolacea]KZN62978.1 hypothetical protein N478_24900 [Pseudoalteromonas luteoviolacea S4060-1]
MRLFIALLCSTSFTGFASEALGDFSDMVVIPAVKTVSVSSYTRAQFDEARTLRSNSATEEHIGKIYSTLTPDEKIQYKFEKGILSTTVTFDQYQTAISQSNKSRTSYYIFWGK